MGEVLGEMALSQEEIESLIEEKLKVLENTFEQKLRNQENLHNQEIDSLQNRIHTLEKDVVILSKELEATTRTANSNDQYLRRNNIEISGIPHELDDNLEEACIALINSINKEPGKPADDIDDDIGEYDIEACHRFRTKNVDGTKNTIIRFTNRKICGSVLKNKKRIKDIKNEDFGNTVKNIYVNENYSQYFKQLSAKCRRLKKDGKIKDTWTSYGLVKIKLLNNTIRVISHQNDLDKLFPNFIYFIYLMSHICSSCLTDRSLGGIMHTHCEKSNKI